jgi:putative transposase
VLDTLHSERFVDKAPAQVYATLLDERTYLCSIRTMYRLLHSAHEVRERRALRKHPPAHKPQLVARGPNQVWSWDITKLAGPIAGVWFCLYVIMDIFSRYVVGWMAAERESEDLARELIEQTCKKQGILPNQLSLHADRGAPMIAQSVAQLLARLGVTKSHSRPRVSDDNPFSEAQFKTLKYCPLFPERFGCIQDVRQFGHRYFQWYNDEHHHSALALLTPADVHHGLAPQRREQRQLVLDAIYRAHPERFRRPPVPLKLPDAVWINRPSDFIVSPSVPVSSPATDTGPLDLPERPGAARSAAAVADHARPDSRTLLHVGATGRPTDLPSSSDLDGDRSVHSPPLTELRTAHLNKKGGALQ